VRIAAVEGELAAVQENMRIKRTEAYQREHDLAAAETEIQRLHARLESTQVAVDKSNSALGSAKRAVTSVRRSFVPLSGSRQRLGAAGCRRLYPGGRR
jgi:septal ring factor EnvC (AmiA/AmiB activator)